MTQDLNDDLYDDPAPAAQRVADGPSTRPPATKMDNIFTLTRGPKTGKVLMVTAGAVLVVAGLIFVLFINRANHSNPLPPSIQGADVGAPPGLQAVPSAALANSPQYNAMMDEVEKKRAAAARAAGQSVHPLAETMIRDLKPVTSQQQVNGPEPGAATPAGQPSQLGQVPSAGQAPTTTQAAQGPLPTGYQPVSYQVANSQDPAVQSQMQKAQEAITALLGAHPRGGQTFTLGEPVPAAPQAAATAHGAGAAAAPGPTQATGGQASAPSRTLIQAGTVESVRLDSGINTDLAGDFVATLVTGPYAGSKLVGTARRTGTLAGLQFRTLSLAGRGVTIPINASGIDANTLEPGTASDVDHKLVAKYLLKPLAGGVAAVGEAVKGSGTTVVVNGASTVQTNPDVSARKAQRIAIGAAAGQVAGDADALNTTPTVRVAPGAIVGIMFTADVVYTPRPTN